MKSKTNTRRTESFVPPCSSAPEKLSRQCRRRPVSSRSAVRFRFSASLISFMYILLTCLGLFQSTDGDGGGASTNFHKKPIDFKIGKKGVKY